MARHRILGIVLAGGAGRRLGPLTADRAKSAVPFGGLYRVVDFALSNLVNGEVQRIWVLTQYKSHSLNRHITTTWRLSPLLDSWVAPVPAQQRLGPHWQVGSADAIYQSLNLIHADRPDIVVVVGADHVYRMDPRQMIDQHLALGSGATIAAIPVPRTDATEFGVVQSAPDGHRIEAFLEKPADPPCRPGVPDEALVSMGSYVFDSDLLVEVLRKDAADDNSRHSVGADIIPTLVREGTAHVYDFLQNKVPGTNACERGYWREVGTLDSYFEAHMDLCAAEPTFNLYNDRWPILTHVPAQPPAKFVHDEGDRVGHAINSVISNGVIVSGGLVRNSVLSPGARVDSWARVERSVILHNSRVRRYAVIENAILDKNVIIAEGATVGVDKEHDRARGLVVSDSGITVVGKGQIVTPLPARAGRRGPADERCTCLEPQEGTWTITPNQQTACRANQNGPVTRAKRKADMTAEQASAVLLNAEDRLVDEAVAALARRDQVHHSTRHEKRRNVRQLFRLILRCIRKGRAEPIITPSEQIAAHCFAAGQDLTEVQEAFNVLAEVLWRHLADALAGEHRIEALGRLNAIVTAGKDAMARTYVALASRGGDRSAEQPTAPGRPGGSGAGAARSDGAADAVVRTGVVGRVGIIILDDQHRRNAIGSRMANDVVAALESLRAEDVRAIVLRAAAGMGVWSAGHDIDELPRGRRDPLSYNDPVEGLLRAVRAFPAPVIAMVHGTVWGGALDLVLSCDLVVADETASFAITPANLGLPYNTTGLLHFVGRLPVNLIREMFFTAAPLDARKAREWLVINHLVASDQLESFTLDLAATMATKSPLAIAVIKEQLRVLSDYQPIAAQVYERIQGLRQEAYDSSDYVEGLNAFAQKRPPIFRGT